MTTKGKILDIIKRNITRDGVDRLVQFLEESDYFTAPASTRFHGAEQGGLAIHSLSVYEELLELHKRLVKRIDIEESLLEKIKGYTQENLAIAGLFHDLCKTYFYVTDMQKASDKQIWFLNKLVNETITDGSELLFKEIEKSGHKMGDITKSYASKLIDHFKQGNKITDLPKFEQYYAVDDKIPLGHGEKSIYILQKFISLKLPEALAIRWHMIAFDASIHFDYPNGLSFRKADELEPMVAMLFVADFTVGSLIKI